MSTSALRQWHLYDADATRAAGHVLGNALTTLNITQTIVITLRGELGVGKTTLVSGLLAALGHQSAVRSPTYTLIEPYELAGRQCYHLDLYRLTDSGQLEDLGVRDLLHPGALLLVEWPEQAGTLFAHPDLSVQLSYPDAANEGRELRLIANEVSLQQLIQSMDIG
jgi:tRNA threonylcarbamoyladenosine biosynthesis protein TsaE